MLTCCFRQPEWVSLKELKEASTASLDAFNNADLLIVDQTQPENRTFLSFQLAMREHISQRTSVVVFEQTDETSITRLQSANYTLLPYHVDPQDSDQLLLGPDAVEPVPLVSQLANIICTTREELPPMATRDIRFREGLKRARRSDLDQAQRLEECATLEAVRPW